MKLGEALWSHAFVIAVLVGLSKFAGISMPIVTPILMMDSTLTLFVALALLLVSKRV